MFNFFRSQGKAVKFLLSAVLALVGLSMLLYLVPNYGSNQNSANPILLQAGDRKLMAQQVATDFQNFARDRIPQQLMSAYFPQWFTDNYKLQYAGLEAARQMGISTGDQEIADYLSATAPFSQFFEKGKLTKRAEFEVALAQSGLTPERVFDGLRDQITLAKLQDAISESAVVTPQEVEDAYKRKYERMSIDYLAFAEADLRNKVSVTDDEIQKRYEATKSSRQQPERFSYRVFVLSKDKVAAGINITEQELRSEYNAALDNFRTPETIHARHILLKTDGKSDDEKKKLLAKAEDLVKQLRGGADFAELAKKNSDDSNAASGGDLGTFGKGAMEKPFEDAAFALKPNDISNVVTTKFGYHIIQVTEKTPSKVTPFETVRADLEKELRAMKVDDAMNNQSTQLQAELAKNPADASAIVKKFGAEVINVKEAARGDAIPTIGVTPEIDSALPAMKVGSATPVLAIPGDRAVIAILDQKIPARQSTLEEARGDIRAQLTDEGARKLVNDKSKEAEDRLMKGEDIQSIAKSLDMKVGTAANFTVSETITDLGSAQPLQDALKKPVGSVIGPVIMQGKTVIAKITSKTAADMAKFAAEKDELRKTIKSQRTQQTDRLWLDNIAQKLQESGDLKVYDGEIQRLAGSFR
jgi:peptidyl-prolyl cis-trans isomerase D